MIVFCVSGIRPAFLNGLLQDISLPFLVKMTDTQKTGGNQHDVVNDPCSGTAQTGSGEAQQRNCDRSCQNAADHFHKARNQCIGGEAHALHAEPHDLQHHQQNIEGIDPFEVEPGVGNDIGFLRGEEQHAELVTQQKADGKEYHAHGATDQERVVNALLQTVIFAGSGVLTEEGRHGSTQSIDRIAHYPAAFAAHGDSGNGSGTERVHRALQCHGANGGNTELQPHGYAVGQQCAGGGPIIAKVIPGQMQQRASAAHIDQTAYGGNTLRTYCGNSSACGAHVKHGNGGNGQHNVDKAGYDQKLQRRAAVTQRPQETGDQIVGHADGDAAEYHNEIRIAHVVDILGVLHPCQNGTTECGGHGGDQHRCDNDKPDGVAYIGAHTVILFCTEAAGNGHGTAAAEPVAEPVDQEHDTAYAANGTQCGRTQKTGDDDTVGNVVELLEQQAGVDGEHKAKNVSGRATDGHIVRHEKRPFEIERSQIARVSYCCFMPLSTKKMQNGRGLQKDVVCNMHMV